LGLILKGKPVREKILEELKSREERVLGVLRCGRDPGADWYLKGIERAAEKTGDNVIPVSMKSDGDIVDAIEQIDNLKRMVHGILLLKPFPENIDMDRMIREVGPEKDVEGIHPENLGRLLLGNPFSIPTTPGAVLEMLKFYHIETEGKHCVIVGRSEVVGKPLALLLLLKNVWDATVTVCHSRTENLEEITRSADILIVSIGRPGFIKRRHVREGAVVIDVGINETDDGIVGDVDFDDVKDIASAITPVPGGVGSITSALILKNLHSL